MNKLLKSALVTTGALLIMAIGCLSANAVKDMKGSKNGSNTKF